MSDSAEAMAASLHQTASQVKFVEPYEPRPIERVKFYHCTALNHKFIRTDGKDIRFIFGIHESADENDQEYLDKEIRRGNPFVRMATEEEILAHRMRCNPHQTIENQVRPQIVDQVSSTLKIRLLEAREKGQVNLTDEQIAMMTNFDQGAALLAGTSGPDRGAPIIKTSTARLREVNGPGGSNIGAVNTQQSGNAPVSNSK